MTETSDSEYFDVTAVPFDADYKECDAFADLGVSNLRPAYNVRLTVKKAIPASLVTHEVIIDVDVSETTQGGGCVAHVVALTQP